MINSTLGRAVTITDLLSGANGAPRTLNGSLPPRASAIIGELRLGIEISRVKAADMREQRPRQPAPLDLVFRRTVLQRLMQLTEGRVAQVSRDAGKNRARSCSRTIPSKRPIRWSTIISAR